MKVSAPCLLLALLPVLTEAQFGGFPLLPSSPRLFFGGFRPLFPPRSRRPPRRPPPFHFQGPTQGPSLGFTQQQNFARPSHSSFGPVGFPSTRATNFRPPTQSRRPQRRPQQHQQQVIEPSGFGAPKPQSIISNSPQGPPRQQHHQTSRPVQHQQHQQQQQQQRPITVQQQQQQQQFLNDPFFHSPVQFISDNSIIGMVPPPPRSASHHQGGGFQPRPSPPPITPRRPQQAPRPSSSSQQSQVHHVQPSFEQIQLSPQAPSQQFSEDLQFQFVPLTRPPQQQQKQQRPPIPTPQQTLAPQQVTVASVPLDPFDLQFNPVNAINSNSLEDLVINKVPAVNAGVLPLAHEKPTQLELFPPFNTRRSG